MLPVVSERLWECGRPEEPIADGRRLGRSLALPDNRIRLEGGHSHVDRDKVERAVRALLLALGEDPDRPGLKDTPRRVADAYA